MNHVEVKNWIANQIKPEQIDRYLHNGNDFIDVDKIEQMILEAERTPCEPQAVREIIQKAFSIQLLSLEEVAILVNIKEPALREEVAEAAKKIKKHVYDNRIVLFAPLYLGSRCLNRCQYCGFREKNSKVVRRILTQEEIRKETEVLAGKIGHKRLVVVFGEHPDSDVHYMAESMQTIYSVHQKVRNGEGAIRRVNINAAPMSIEDLAILNENGIGTFQVFQESYHKRHYAQVHPKNTLKGNYRWRAYAHHRAMEAGIDDVAIGALFGLADWRFEVMGMVAHAYDLEKQFGIGPHTISVPRLEPAVGTSFGWVKHWVNDEDFRYLVAVLRLAIPYCGLIVTNREKPQMIHDLIGIITQRDADSRVGVGAYFEAYQRGEFDRSSSVDHSCESWFQTPQNQNQEKQQFVLGDTRNLDTIIRELASQGHIVSFCTAGYRCGRTGKKIMQLLESGVEGCFCKLNAILTFREWLEDFGSEETQQIGQKIIDQEIAEVKARIGKDYTPQLYDHFIHSYQKIVEGKRDLYL